MERDNIGGIEMPVKIPFTDVKRRWFEMGVYVGLLKINIGLEVKSTTKEDKRKEGRQSEEETNDLVSYILNSSYISRQCMFYGFTTYSTVACTVSYRTSFLTFYERSINVLNVATDGSVFDI